MYIPFGHSFWAFFGHVFEQMLIIWVVGFWATREPRQGPRREWRGPGNCGSVPSGYFVVQQLDLYRVGHADLEGQRFVSCFFGSIKKVCFITQSTEPLTLSILLPNRKCRLFSAWWVQGIEVRRNVHFFGPALRAPSCRMTLRVYWAEAWWWENAQCTSSLMIQWHLRLTVSRVFSARFDFESGYCLSTIQRWRGNE